MNLDPEAASQSAATLSGLRIAMTVPSVVLLIIGIIVYKSFYKLDDGMMEKISAKLKK